MKKERTKIYIKANPEERYITCSGIEFFEFIKYLPRPINNLMVLMGGNNVISLETICDRGLELFEGQDFVESLTKKNIHALGDFCFVDYASRGATTALGEEQIAELLYLGHMYKPLYSPFFEPLQNRFAYLSHDDGWYCKLYCRELEEFAPILFGKIAVSAKIPFHDNSDIINKRLLQLATNGVLIDLDEISHEEKRSDIKIFSVGEYLDMDKVLNNFQKLKKSAAKVNVLSHADEKWRLI